MTMLKKEYELVYADKEREEDILACTIAAPLQPVKTFRNGGDNNDWTNMLIFGDNLQVLKTLLQMKQEGKLRNADGTPGVRLVYIDPPFATNQEFRNSQGQKAYQDKLAGVKFLEFLRKRLVFLREILSEDGSIYVHLDWHIGHYVKVIMDEVFGEDKLINEIIWCYETGGVPKKGFPKKHETLLFYTKNRNDFCFNALKIRKYLRHWIPRKGVEVFYDGNEDKLFRYKICPDFWVDIDVIRQYTRERIGYPTQKPEALLDRIVKISSNPGDLMLDCFAGSGTTLAVAEKLGRRWIGVDCGKLAIYTIQKRLLNINKSKDLEDPQKKKKYGKPCKPFTLYNAGLYDIDVNDTVDVECRYFLDESKKTDLLTQKTKECVIKIEKFESRVISRKPLEFANLETLSMIMLDYDFDGKVFNLDEVFYAEELKKNGYEVRFAEEKVKGQIMVIYIDIFGNEKREVKVLPDFL